MMTKLVFDLESNGLLDALSTIHCLGVSNVETGWSGVGNNHSNTIEALLNQLQRADVVIGHNIINFDIPAITKVYPWFQLGKQVKVVDTLILSRLIYADLSDWDNKLIKANKLPQRLFKSHSLEAWGYRLGNNKGEYSGGWDAWSQDMEDYCEQDVAVTLQLYKHLMAQEYSQEAMDLEHSVAHIIQRQTSYGYYFNTQAAVKLWAEWTDKLFMMGQELTQVFKPRVVPKGKPFIPKRDNAKMGYVTGVPVQKYETLSFNPNSRAHITAWLKELYDWSPTEFTPSGEPKVDESVLKDLPYPEAIALTKYMTLAKRISQMATGKGAWLHYVDSQTSRIYGSVITNGAVTGRMTHSKPNLAQVPAGYSPYGHECRSLFTVPAGKELVGADAAALELCCLAGYMARLDNGAYIETVLKGDKSNGTDIHSVNAKALGLDPKLIYPDGQSGRDMAKTWFYAFVYGAGDVKLGTLLTTGNLLKVKDAGTASRKRFMKNLPALGTLIKQIQDKVKSQGFLKGLDGRTLHIRGAHSAPNTLLQSAGAILMKKALVILDGKLQADLGLVAGVDYEFVANVHDEWQIECNKGLGETIGKIAKESIKLAGEHFGFRCPLDGDYKVGTSWAETH